MVLRRSGQSLGPMDLHEAGSEAGDCIIGITREFGSSKTVGPKGETEEDGHVLLEREDRQSIQHLRFVKVDEYKISLDLADNGIIRNLAYEPMRAQSGLDCKRTQ